MAENQRAIQQTQHREHWAQCLPLLDLAIAGTWPKLGTTLHGLKPATWLNFLSAQDLDDGFHWLVQRNQAGAALPGWMVLHLLAANAWGKARRADLVAALAEFAQAAEAVGTPWLLLKGLHYSARFYGHLDARQTRDLDILAEPETRDATVSVLKKLGYRCEEQAGLPTLLPVGLQQQLEHASTWHRGHVSIDLHHALRVRPGWQMDSATLFAAAGTVELNGLMLGVPGDHDALTMLALMLTTDIEQGLVRARSLLDLQVALEVLAPTFDWQAWQQHCARRGVLAEVQAALGVLSAALPRSTASSQWPKSVSKAGWARAPCSPEQALTLLSGLPYNLHNRRWFMHHYSGPRSRYLAWWLLGGFFREGSVRRLLAAVRPARGGSGA